MSSGAWIGKSVTPLSSFCIALLEKGHRQVDSLAGAVRPRKGNKGAQYQTHPGQKSGVEG